MVTHLPPLSLPVTPPHSIPLLCSLFSSCLPILWQVNAQQACLAYTHIHAHTQPEVVCNRGFQGGQQDRQFNLRGKEGWWESKRERKIQGGGECDRKRDRRGERLRPGHVCETQTGGGGRGKLYYSSTPQRKKSEWEEVRCEELGQNFCFCRHFIWSTSQNSSGISLWMEYIHPTTSCNAVSLFFWALD